MKTSKILSVTSLMLMSTQLFSAAVENDQIMPPPGPYKSIMSNTPPAFVPQGSQQAQPGPFQHNRMPQAFSRFPGNVNPPLQATGYAQQPEWLLSKQEENREKIQAMLKENEQRNKENEKRFVEYLKKAESLAESRSEESKKWIEKNNIKLKQYWQAELDKFSKMQRKQIEQAKGLPDWIKQKMLAQQKNQLTMMKNNPPNPNFSAQQQQQSGFRSPSQINFAPANMQYRRAPVQQMQPRTYRAPQHNNWRQGAMQRPFIPHSYSAPLPSANQVYKPSFNRQYAPAQVHQPQWQPNTNPYNRYTR